MAGDGGMCMKYNLLGSREKTRGKKTSVIALRTLVCM